MAFKGSKGWYVQQLKQMGITKHPVELKKLELFKTFILRNLYFENDKKNKNKKNP